MDRRAFIEIFLGSAAIAIGANGSAYSYFNNQERRIIENPDSYILADFHAHLSNHGTEEDLLKVLSGKLTGIAFKKRRGIPILTYEDAVMIDGINEIEDGFAIVDYGGKRGYIIRCQEVSSDNHILGIGMHHYIDEPHDARRAIQLVKGQDALAMLCHPYLIPKWHGVVMEADGDEIAKIDDLAKMSDLIEVFNASAIDLVPLCYDRRMCNDKAKKLAQRFGKNGLNNSDTHYINSTLHTTGVFLPKADMSRGKILENLVSGNYKVASEQYLSRGEVLLGLAREEFRL